MARKTAPTDVELVARGARLFVCILIVALGFELALRTRFFTNWAQLLRPLEAWRLVVFLVVAWLVSRGQAWLCWVLVLLCGLGALSCMLSALAVLPSALWSAVGWLLLAVAYAAGAGLLALAPSVRAYLATQGER